jgi:hypothetical protein
VDVAVGKTLAPISPAAQLLKTIPAAARVSFAGSDNARNVSVASPPSPATRLRARVGGAAVATVATPARGSARRSV